MARLGLGLIRIVYRMCCRTLITLACLISGLFVLPAAGYDRPVIDGDADGIPDDRDACPYSTRGPVVGPNGCSTPGDEDEDGVADVVDACPLSPVGALVDAQGCALDRDVDGIADGVDVCPSSRLGVRVDARGCAPGEQAVVGLMARPRPAAMVAVAPPVPVAAPVPASAPAPGSPGAPVPVTPIAVEKPKTAAPASRSEDLALAHSQEEWVQTIHFDGGEADLSWSAARAAKKIAAELRPRLQQDPRLSVLLSGHADTKSDGASAARLASARAAIVRELLLAAGIPAARIAVRVPGVNEPRFDGAQLAKNCRAELRLQTDVRTASVQPPAAVGAPVMVASSTPVLAPKPATLAHAKAPVPAGAASVSASAEHSPTNVSIAFAPYSAVLDAPSTQLLTRFVRNSTRPLLADGDARVVVVSGVDADETGAAALQLAESRAASVLAYLVGSGLPRNRLEFSSSTQTGTRRAELSVASR